MNQLVQFLSQLPASLTRLELSGERLDARRFGRALQWPVTLRELNLRLNVYVRFRNPDKPADLAEKERDMARRVWIEALPTHLRTLDLFAVPVSEGMATGIVEKMPARAPMVRMVLYLQRKWVTDVIVALLKTKFVVHVLV
ncbi:hypothetical protein GGF32_004645 [Allomyces javanicus]|nr:hypothetical protein GGF32_004645 [Allomyces javanicus]